MRLATLAVMLGACAGSGSSSSNPPGGSSSSMADARTAPRPDGSSGTSSGGVDAGTGGEPTGDCMGVSEGGSCAGTMLTFCEAGMVENVDCAEFMVTCECDGTGYCDCAGEGGGGGPDGGPSGGGMCGAVTEGGNCTGTRLEYCEEGMLFSVDCVAVGATACECDPTGWCDCY
jgi:hypothetical protein